MSASRVLIILGLIVGLVGCGGSKSAPVNGTLVFADKPDEPATELAGYTIMFEALEGGNESSVGIVGKDGRFTMSTFKEGDGGLKGKMKVAVTPPIGTNSSMTATKIDPRHHAFATSGLEVEIGSGPNNITLKVDRLPKIQPQ